MNGFYISIKNDLLEEKHHIAMGKSVWLYMWLLDKMTSVSEDGVGKVLGGRPVRHEDFVGNLNLSRRTYARYVKQLEEAGYVKTTRTPYGLVFYVQKAKKVFGDPVENSKKRSARSGTSVTKSGTSLTKNGTSNKTIQLDNTIRQLRNDKYKTPKQLNMPDLGSDFYDKFDVKKVKQHV